MDVYGREARARHMDARARHKQGKGVYASTHPHAPYAIKFSCPQGHHMHPNASHQNNACIGAHGCIGRHMGAHACTRGRVGVRACGGMGVMYSACLHSAESNASQTAALMAPLWIQKSLRLSYGRSLLFLFIIIHLAQGAHGFHMGAYVY